MKYLSDIIKDILLLPNAPFLDLTYMLKLQLYILCQSLVHIIANIKLSTADENDNLDMYLPLKIRSGYFLERLKWLPTRGASCLCILKIELAYPTFFVYLAYNFPAWGASCLSWRQEAPLIGITFFKKLHLICFLWFSKQVCVSWSLPGHSSQKNLPLLLKLVDLFNLFPVTGMSSTYTNEML